MGIKDCKLRYFKKTYENAKTVKCKCGCGKLLKNKDRYGRDKFYVNGHNARKYHGEDSGRWSAEKRWRMKNPEKVRDGKRNFYRQRKLEAMKLLGNKCVECGLKYNGKNAPFFEFHHLDPSAKESGITRMLVNKAWRDTLKELKQCVLVCACCHNGIHGGEW